MLKIVMPVSPYFVVKYLCLLLLLYLCVTLLVFNIAVCIISPQQLRWHHCGLYILFCG
jgi:hypothetical protein